MIRIIIAGSRSFTDWEYMWTILDIYRSYGDFEIVCGLAKGADRLGLLYAKDRKLPWREFPAEWDRLGKAAGVLRNGEMAAYADYCIVFWDGYSSGTNDMILQCHKHGIKDVGIFLF